MSIDGTWGSASSERPDSPAVTGRHDSQRAEHVAAPRHDGHDTSSQARAETLTREEYADLMRSHGPPIPRDNGQERRDGDGQPYLRFSVVGAERTVGDTTPTGIGLKPTGEQLLEMDGDDPSRSRLDRLFDEAFKDADDVRDIAGHIGEAIEADVRSGPGPSGHPRSYHASTAVAHDHPSPPGPAVSDVVGSVAVTGVATIVAIRHAISELRKEHQP